MNQTWENDKKPRLRPGFGLFDPNSGCQFFFSKIWLRQSVDIIVNIRKKTNDQILRKIGDGRADGQTDQRDFLRCSPTNIEHPKLKSK